MTRLSLFLAFACACLAGASAIAAPKAQSVFLSEALDQPNWVFDTGGAAAWFGQADDSHDDEDAARSGNPGDDAESWVETTIQGAGEVSFWWKVSSEQHFDVLEFSIDGALQDKISGSVPWTLQTYELDEGTHTLRWRYVKDVNIVMGEDVGWVDQIVFDQSDPLTVSPEEAWEVTGFTSFPISETRNFSLTNEGDESISWNASSAADWLDLTPASGTLAPGNSTELSADIGADVTALPAGFHEADIVIANDSTGVERVRAVNLTLHPAPGGVAVADSISPDDDHELPFREVSLGVSRTETIWVRNIDPKNDLLIEGIQLRSIDQENLSQSALQTSSETTKDSDGEVSGAGAPDRGRSDTAPPPDWSRAHDGSNILVRFKSSARAAERVSAHNATGGRVAHTMRRIPLDVVELPTGADPRAILAAYKKNPAVEYAEPNYIVSFNSEPDDPRLSELWGLRNTGQSNGTPGADISALDAWSWTTGSEEIVVAVIDSGIDYEHPDLAANMWINPDPTFDDIHGATWTNGNGSVSNGDPMDDAGHGTHVAGTIGAVGNNGIGVTGVNWNVRLMALKFLDSDGFGTIADAIAALEYAIEHGAHISNNSWGGGGFSQALFDMISAAGEANQLFVAAAGNQNTDNDTDPAYPASFGLDNILSVASSTRDDDRSSFSNYGAQTVHLAAPGSGILSTVPGGGYEIYFGTSMAAPHVTGAAALVLALDPWAEYRTVKEAILASVTPLPQWEGLVTSGGRLNASAALVHSVKGFRIPDPPQLPLALPPGRSLAVEVIFEPRETGPHEANVLIETQTLDDPLVEVHLNGEGVADSLHVVEEGGLVSQGFLSGPFQPESKTYTLRNSGGEALQWSASAEAEWLTLEPPSGSLAAGEQTGVEVTINSASQSLPEGIYEDTVAFANLSSGLMLERHVQLEVQPLPGRLLVTDSLAPADDLHIPFDTIAPDGEQNASIVLENTHESNRLIVENILLLGGFREDFKDTYLQGWAQAPANAWSLSLGKYRARDHDTTGFMQSTYIEEMWYNALFEVQLDRAGDVDNASALLMRASPDFDFERGVGSAIVLGVSGSGYYYVGRFLDGKFQWIQPWTESDLLNTGNSTNTLTANIREDRLHVFANENLLWSGTVNGLFRPGHFGLAAFSHRDNSTVHLFEHVDIQEPFAEDILPLSLVQSWYNSRADESSGSPVALDSPAPAGPIPDGKQTSEQAFDYAEVLNRQETFALPEAPDFPLTIAPLESETLPVRFTPTGEGAFSRTVRILSNDPDQPVVDVRLDGSSELDPLRLFPVAPLLAQGEAGGPFTPSSVSYALFNAQADGFAWEVVNAPIWLNVEPEWGVLQGESFADLAVSIDDQAEGLAVGEYSGALEIANTETGHVRSLPMNLSVRPSLCVSLQACHLSWTTGGDARWRGQTHFTRRTDVAAQSGAIGNDHESWAETVVTGPGELTFWWAVSSEKGWDFLEFRINGERQGRISGEEIWQKETYSLLEGEHALRWQYAKDFSLVGGEDAGWLDEVTWTAAMPTRLLEADAELQFGVVSVGDSATRILPVNNTGNSTLSIASISFPDGFSGNWQSATLAPGASRDLEVTFTPVADQSYDAALQFVSDATSEPDAVQLFASSVPSTEPFELENGQTVHGLTAAEGEELYFLIDVPQGREFMEVAISGGSGDADLYVRKDVPPTLTDWDERPFQVGNKETVRIDYPLQGLWHFMLHAYKGFADVSITARFADLDFDSWTTALDLPLGERGLMDRHGPLQVTNLQAYAFGLDPRTLAAADLPRMERSPDNPNEMRVLYRVQTNADDVAMILETSPDLVVWKPAAPTSETVLSDSGGVEVREALFETGGEDSLFVRATMKYTGETQP